MKHADHTAILAIETATATCSVALFANGKIYQREQLAPKEHNNLLLPMVQSLLNEGAITLENVNIAVSLGPGSFVGTRLGVCAASSLAYAAKVGVYGFSTLTVLAQHAIAQQPDCQEIITVLDAQLGGVYWSHFTQQNGVLVPKSQNNLSSREEFTHIQQSHPNAVVYGLDEGNHTQHLYPSATALVQLTQQAIADGQAPIDALAVEPIYLRHQVATAKAPQKNPA